MKPTVPELAANVAEPVVVAVEPVVVAAELAEMAISSAWTCSAKARSVSMRKKFCLIQSLTPSEQTFLGVGQGEVGRGDCGILFTY